MRRLIPARNGNFGATFALIAAPLLVGVGASIDYVRAYNVRVKMQYDLDAALLSAVKSVDAQDEAAIRRKITTWFAGQTRLAANKYALSDTNIVVDRQNRTIRATVSGNLPTTILGIANVRSMNVAVRSAVAGPESSYLNVYVVLDKSASMMLAATPSGQSAMKSVTGGKCVFACHTPEGGPYTYNDQTYTTNYDVAKAMGVELRADISVEATKKVLSLIAAADPAQQHIRVGLYSIGSKATEVLAPTFSTSSARTVLVNDANGLTSMTSEPATYFNQTLPALAGLVGAAGEGTALATPRKLVLLLTDGVQSDRPWVMSNDKGKTTPLNPAWCKAMKDNDVTVGVLYTQYLPMTFDGGYNRTVGDTMKSSEWSSLWGGEIRPDIKNQNKITRLEYIPYALQDCASSSDLFISAADPDDIEKGLSELFQQYLTNVRLTQ